jgi:hypothetical protein
LNGIKKYRHGGALLLSATGVDLNVKYEINYERLKTSMENAALWLYKSTDLDRITQLDYVQRNRKIPYKHYEAASEAELKVESFNHEITGCVRFIASLSRIDGLVYSTPDLIVRGFGAEIRTAQEVDEVYVASTPNAKGNSLRRIAANYFGTRHRSMMRFCLAQPESVGFVVSQDGDIRVMTCVENRIVIWENPKVLSFSPPRSEIEFNKAREGTGSDRDIGVSHEITDDDIPF